MKGIVKNVDERKGNGSDELWIGPFSPSPFLNLRI
jgi:hypothetical protein